ncbi:divergent PAP2 family protein [Spirochaeta lutea]|uniref:divergent PAP2 family protein n=1 Tax=Spirochaeta lutea TaxID=1480694 RepID=UPI0009DCF106|nr:divergent PAP2 family protein [Spirochaeta lutea]
MASAAFSVSAVFSLIVIYDAYRLRGEVQKHAQVLNRLRATLELKDEAVLNEMVGHSLAEILWGIVYGLSVTSVVLLTLGF